MHYTYQTTNVCAKFIEFEINGNVVTNIKFTGGCNGNLKAIAKLLDGKTVDEITAACKGNTCGSKFTSCTDQLALAVSLAYTKANNLPDN